MLGEYSYGGTPSYIPNLEVKPIYADGTWLEAAWESMDLPSKLLREKLVLLSLFILFLQEVHQLLMQQVLKDNIRIYQLDRTNFQFFYLLPY